jgi:hypothetical protein
MESRVKVWNNAANHWTCIVGAFLFGLVCRDEQAAVSHKSGPVSAAIGDHRV